MRMKMKISTMMMINLIAKMTMMTANTTMTMMNKSLNHLLLKKQKKNDSSENKKKHRNLKLKECTLINKQTNKQPSINKLID